MATESFQSLTVEEIKATPARVQLALTTRAMLRALPTLAASHEPPVVIELCHGLGLLGLITAERSRASGEWLDRLGEEFEFIRPRLGFPTPFVEAAINSVDTVLRSFLAGESWASVPPAPLFETTLDALQDAAESARQAAARGDEAMWRAHRGDHGRFSSSGRSPWRSRLGVPLWHEGEGPFDEYTRAVAELTSEVKVGYAEVLAGRIERLFTGDAVPLWESSRRQRIDSAKGQESGPDPRDLLEQARRSSLLDADLDSHEDDELLPGEHEDGLDDRFEEDHQGELDDRFEEDFDDELDDRFEEDFDDELDDRFEEGHDDEHEEEGEYEYEYEYEAGDEDERREEHEEDGEGLRDEDSGDIDEIPAATIAEELPRGTQLESDVETDEERAEAPTAAEAAADARERPAAATLVVNTGLSSRERPDEAIPPDSPLQSGEPYYLWFEASAPITGSIDRSPAALPTVERLPGAELRVRILDPDGEIGIDRDVEGGTFRLEPDGTAVVLESAARPEGSSSTARRLFFPVRMPFRSGSFRLNCELHHQGALFQSRRIELTALGPFRRLLLRLLRRFLPELARRRLHDSRLEREPADPPS